MKVLLLGGTGAIGNALTEILISRGHTLYITSRQERVSNNENIYYIKGNAHDDSFLEDILINRYDCIIDFMVYKFNEFNSRYKKLLDSTFHYVFISSCRVYSNENEVITESTSRILDICDDSEYLGTDEYALTKARQENLLIGSGCNNWTIIRPYITYSEIRMQLGVYEKEQWLQRALDGRTIVFSRNIAKKTTSMTSSFDVANGIADIIGSECAKGESIHIVNPESMSWDEVLHLYLNIIEDVTGKRPCVKYIDSDSMVSQIMRNKYQHEYDRLYDRRFDSSKMSAITNLSPNYISMSEGLSHSLRSFLESKKHFKHKSWELDAYFDRLTGETVSICDIPTVKEKLKYLIARYTPYFNIRYRK